MNKKCYFCDKPKVNKYKKINSDKFFCFDCLRFKQEYYKSIGKKIDFEKLIDKDDLGRLYVEFQ